MRGVAARLVLAAALTLSGVVPVVPWLPHTVTLYGVELRGGSPSQDVDTFAASTIRDVLDFWRGNGFDVSGLRFEVFDIRVPYSHAICDGKRQEYSAAAAFCYPNELVFWDREGLEDNRERLGDWDTVFTMAHEIGHAMSRQLNLKLRLWDVLSNEQVADCLAGAEFASRNAAPEDVDAMRRTVADFGIDAGVSAEGMEDFDPTIAVRHGTSVERVMAWSAGYEGGITACPFTVRPQRITDQWLISRDLPMDLRV